jgi:hypothetical protein
MSNSNFGTIIIRGVPVIAAKFRDTVYLARPMLLAVLGYDATGAMTSKVIPGFKSVEAGDIPTYKSSLINHKTQMIDLKSATNAILNKRVPVDKIEALLKKKRVIGMLNTAVDLPELNVDIDARLLKLEKVDVNPCLTGEKHSDDHDSVMSDGTLEYGDHEIPDLNSDESDHVLTHVDIRGIKVICVKYESNYYLSKSQLLVLIGKTKINGDEFARCRTIPATQLIDLGILKNDKMRANTKFIEFGDAIRELKRRGKISTKVIAQIFKENDYIKCLTEYAATLPVSKIQLPTCISSQPAVIGDKKRKRVIVDEESNEESIEEPPKKKLKQSITPLVCSNDIDKQKEQCVEEPKSAPVNVNAIQIQQWQEFKEWQEFKRIREIMK